MIHETTLSECAFSDFSIRLASLEHECNALRCVAAKLHLLILRDAKKVQFDEILHPETGTQFVPSQKIVIWLQKIIDEQSKKEAKESCNIEFDLFLQTPLNLFSWVRRGIHYSGTIGGESHLLQPVKKGHFLQFYHEYQKISLQENLPVFNQEGTFFNPHLEDEYPETELRDCCRIS